MKYPDRFLRCALAALLAWALSTPTASAYYSFIHYNSTTAPFTAAPEKFDLTALSNNTVYYLVSSQGPTTYAPGDSFDCLLSVLRQAADNWNSVDTSALRIAFGGLFDPTKTTQKAPHIEIQFTDELPPGVLGEGGPVTSSAKGGGPSSLGSIQTGASGPFVPILTSVVYLNSDLSGQASYGTPFLMTVVHEIGHALGLQHTFTSAAMSVEVTRATTHSAPIAADDVAGISWLYPNSGFATSFGSISGQVTMSGSGVPMASVVALTPYGDAISALSAPDGTYRIDGVPPGSYYVYVHPLPPASEGLGLGPGDITLPLDPTGKSIAAGGYFSTQFYPGTRNATQAAQVPVEAGAVSTGINFSVQSRGTPEIYGVTTYGYSRNDPVKPAFIDLAGSPSDAFLIANGNGLISNVAPAPGLSLSILGFPIFDRSSGLLVDPSTPDWLSSDWSFLPLGGSGVRHLIFSLPDDIYVLPSGLVLAVQDRPQITAIAGSGNGTVTLTGSTFLPDTRVMFDGNAAIVNSVNYDTGTIVVTPPPGISGYTANVVALNSDGQSSMGWTETAPTYTYGQSAAPAVTLAPAALPAGIEAEIDITGVNTHFADGETVVGFGSSDIAVKTLWVISPTLVRAGVVVSSAAAAQSTTFTVVTGFERVTQSAGFAVQAANSSMALGSNIVSQATGRAPVFPGDTALLTVTNLPAGTSLVLTLNGAVVSASSAGTNQVVFQVPSSISPGYALLGLQAGGTSALPVIVSIGVAPPSIQSIEVNYGPVNAANPAHPGDVIVILASGANVSNGSISTSGMTVSFGGIAGTVSNATVTSGQYTLTVKVPNSVTPGAQVPVIVTIGGESSQAFPIVVTP